MALNGQQGKVEGLRDDGRVFVKLTDGVTALLPMNLKVSFNFQLFCSGYTNAPVPGLEYLPWKSMNHLGVCVLQLIIVTSRHHIIKLLLVNPDN